jgi:hypothetical protein
MEKSVSPQNDTVIKQAIIKHVKQLHSIQEDNIGVEDLSLTLSSLPKRYDYYRVERKDRPVNNFVCFYTVVNGKLFTSSVREDFSRLLRQEKFLETSSFTPSQFVSLFNLMFSIPINQNVVVSLEHIDDSDREMIRILELDKNQDKLPQMKKSRAELK